MINDIVRKIEMCIDYQTLYALEDDFNDIGLTVQVTSNNKVVLCKLIDGKPKADKAIDDYIYIGSSSESTKEISPCASIKIIAFVRQSSGKAGKVADKARGWRDGIRMYGKAIRIGEHKEHEEAITEGKESAYPMTES